MQNRGYSPVTLWLVPILILSSVGPSGNNEANKFRDFEIPRNWQNYEKKDQKEERLPPHLPDINTLFKELDELERMDTENPNMVQYPSSPQPYIHSERLPDGPQAHTLRQDKYPENFKPFNLDVKPVGPQSYLLKPDIYNEFLKPSNLDVMNVGRIDQMTGFQRDNYWDENPSEIQSNPLPSGTPKTMTGYTPRTTRFPIKTTAVIRPSTYCLSEATPFRPATTKSPDSTTSTTIQTTRKPSPYPRPSPTPTPSPSPMSSTISIPITSKVPSKPKSRKKSKLLSAKKAKILLDTILTTKQHVLSVLKTLNYLEMEVLSQSPEDCSLQNIGQSQPKKTWEKPQKLQKPQKPLKPLKPLKPPKPLKLQKLQKLQKPYSPTHSQTFFFGIRPASQLEGDSVMALAKEEELKLKSRVWEEYQQHMRDMFPSKSRRFKMAPQAGVRLGAVREPQGSQEVLKYRNSLEELPSKDISAFGAPWN